MIVNSKKGRRAGEKVKREQYKKEGKREKNKARKKTKYDKWLAKRQAKRKEVS